VGFLKTEDRIELLKELKLEKSKRYADRIRVVLLLDQSWTHQKIAEALFLDESSVLNFKKRYENGGIEGLINDQYFGRISFLSDKNIEILKTDLRSCMFLSTKAVIEHVQNKFKITYSRGGMTDLLHRIGFSFKKATPVPGKAVKEKQEQFVKDYESIKSQGKVYFSDSTHPEFAPYITYGWIEKGERFDVKTNSGWRKRVNICGALELSTLDIITRTHDTINSNSICELLRSIKQRNLKEDFIYLVLDGAGYNRAKKVKIFAKKLKINLIYLPAYSPNLNPIERLWKFMKKKVTANRHYEEFNDFKNSLRNFFRGIRQYKDELRTLLTDNFPILGT
jgi:transposase